MAPTNTRLELFSAADIAARPELLHSLVSLINLSFSGFDGFPELRYSSGNDNDFIEELGSTAICAVIFDEADEPIATGSVKPWVWSKDTDEIVNLEVSVVVASPRYRGHGLADRCVRAVERAAILRQRELHAGKEPEIRLWLKTIVKHNLAYWTRRGFVVAESRIAPAGLWGALHEFEQATMMRRAVWIEEDGV